MNVALGNFSNTVKLFLLFVLICSISACSRTTVDPITNEDQPFIIELSATDDSGANVSSIPPNSEINIAAQIVIQNSQLLSGQSEQPLSGHVVNFTTNLGTVIPASKLTDENGIARIRFNTADIESGVVSITASSTINEISASKIINLEVATPPVAVTNVTLGITLQQQEEDTNQVKQCESAQLAVTVLSDDQPVADALVEFTASIGLLSANTALTNAQGIAEVTVTGGNELGAGLATASVIIADRTYSAQLVYSITEQQSLLIELTATDNQNLPVIALAQNTEINLSAQLVVQNQQAGQEELELSGHVMTFTTNSGTVIPATKLTDDQGLASVRFNTAEVEPGVVTITASTTIEQVTTEQQINLEVLPPTTEINDVDLSIYLKKDDTNTNQIKQGESAQLGVTVMSNGQPVNEAFVEFTAELGNLSARTALSNAQGVAEITITGNDSRGAAYATATVIIAERTYTDQLAYSIVDGDVVNEEIKIGYFDTDNNFVEGVIKTDIMADDNSSTISAGATLGLSVTIVDANNQPLSSSAQVSFTSSCVVSGDATLDTNVSTIAGVAKATYQDVSCATAQGNEDTIVASITANSQDLVASHLVKLQPEQIGSIEFVSATPSDIVLKGTGGQGKQETSTLTFLVKGELGNPLAQQQVSFSLNTDAGGLTLASTTGVTNADGLVSAKVIAGTVPTAIRVTATVTSENGTVITTQSDLLSISTGIPDQNSITLALSQLNPEARDFIGNQITVSAYLADSFNNPVPDGTTVNFTTEGGAIEPSCNTENGRCAVIWTSQEPFPLDHRVTILATAIGHETFVDVNGNNMFDDGIDTNNDGSNDVAGDGTAANGTIGNIDQVLSGFARPDVNIASGFIDMPEAWRDDNENYIYDEASGEQFIDSNNNGTRDDVDGLFNGPQCSGALCATDSKAKFVTVRKSAILITSSSHALYQMSTADSDGLLVSNYPEDAGSIDNSLALNRGDNAQITIKLSDTKLQTLPQGTTINVSTGSATAIGSTSYIINNTIGTSDVNGFGGIEFTVTIANNLALDDDATVTGITVTTTTPAGIVTSASATINLN